MKRYDIYGIGAALVDTEISVTDEFLQEVGVEKGLMTLVDETKQQEITSHMMSKDVSCKLASGGSACNTVFAASCFGSKNFYSGKIANDENGAFFTNDLQSVDIDFHCEALESGTTGKCLVMITPDAERSMNTFLGANDEFSTSDIDIDALKASQYLYIEGYLVSSDTRKKAAIEAKTIAQQHSVKTSLSLSDPAMVQFFGDGIREMIGDGVDLLFGNKEEAMQLTGSSTLEETLEALKQYARTFAITLGAEGAVVFDGQQIVSIEGKAVKAIDTNGAGDMFAGAFLHAILNDQDYATAASFANNAAAKVVSQYGPRLAIEDHEKLV